MWPSWGDEDWAGRRSGSTHGRREERKRIAGPVEKRVRRVRKLYVEQQQALSYAIAVALARGRRDE